MFITKKYNKEFLTMLTNFEKIIGDKGKKYCIHVPHIGEKYFKTKELLLIGRAHNGIDLSDEEAIFVPEKHNSKNVFNHEIDDTSTSWLKDYKITSCFFRICKKYLLKKGYDKSDWADNFVWSNIMKISPAKGGNPTDKEWKIQLEGCKKLFKQEIDYFSPKLVLMLTDFNWAYDFIKSLEINPDKTEITNRHKFIKGKYFYNDSTILVFERPEGKEEEKFVKKIIEMSQGEKNGRRTEY